MSNNIFRYRIITNLQCNNRCKFCYQTYKPPVGVDEVLDIFKLVDTLDKVKNKNGILDRATIMGGESLLLDNIESYFKTVKPYVNKLCLVTNGKLIGKGNNSIGMLKTYLDEIAVSISNISDYKLQREVLIELKKEVPGLRINLPRCEDSSNDRLRELIYMILNDDIGCVVCEDLMGRYGEPHDKVIESWKGVTRVRDDNHNFVTYSLNGKEFGLFAHYSGYDKTDMIISPRGNFASWEAYCNSINNFDLR